MGNENDAPDNSTVKAPTYNELFSAVTELREKLRFLEASTDPTSPPVASTPTVNVTPSVDYRILPDVGTSIWTFTGHETSNEAEDWISSIDGLMHVKQWPLRYRILYVRSHVAEAARSWYLLEEFLDWDTFVSKFRSTFVRTIRKADLWRELESRVQSPTEPTIDYFYAKIGLCRSLELTFAETRDYILEGLRSQQQVDWVSGRVQTNREQLLNDIRDWERLRVKRQMLFTTVTPSRRNDVTRTQQRSQLARDVHGPTSEPKPVL